MNLIEAMESVPRCILRYVPELGWSATDIEGASDDSLTWHKAAVIALAQMLDVGKILALRDDASEIAWLREIEARGQRWVCEWWHGPRGEGEGEWLRPFSAYGLPQPL